MSSDEAEIHGQIRTPAHPPIKRRGGAPRPAPRIEVQVFYAATGAFRTTATVDRYTWSYVAQNLPTGDYVVRAHDTKGAYLDTWWPRSPTRELARRLHVEAGILWTGQNQTGIDFHMIPVPRLEGQVLTLDGPRPWDIEVTAFDRSTGAVAGGVSGINDRYSLRLPPGRYAVLFHDPTGRFEDQWYSQGTTLETATPVELGVDANATNVNVFLVQRQQPPGAITGRVIASDGSSPGRVEVVVRDEQARQVATGSGDPAGAFRIEGMTAGSYRLSAHSPDHGFLQAWFDRKSSVDTADAVVVRAGVDTSEVNIIVTRVGGSILGSALGPDGAPPTSKVEVRAVPLDGNRAPLITHVDPDGRYRFEHIPPGDYRVVFLPSSAELAPQWFNAVNAESEATPIAVSVNTASGGVDARLRRVGASISGKVTTGDGGAIPGRAWVFLSRPDGYHVGNALIASDGSYLLADLEPGNYRLEIWLDDPYLKIWYPGATDEVDASIVSVGLGQSRTGIDAVVPVGAAISGTVTAGDGSPLPAGVSVRTWNESVSTWDQTEVAADGRYRLDGLAAGTYAVMVEDPSGRLIRCWYPGVTDEASASGITLRAGEVRSGVDLAVPTSTVALTGKIATSDGRPLPTDIVASLMRPGEDEPITDARVAADGSYILRGFPSGTYDLRVEDRSEEYEVASEWSVPLTTGIVDRNVVLTVRGSISGTISTSDGNAVPTNVLVEAYAASTGELARQAFATAIAGDYRIGGLAPADYKVFVRTLGEYSEQWYPGKSSQLDAFAIGVARSQAVTGIDLVLHP